MFRKIGVIITRALGAIGRTTVAGFLRSVDPTANFAQKVATKLGLGQVELFVWQVRVEWRRWFEAKICAMGEARIRETIDVTLQFYADAGYGLPPQARDTLFAQLVHALADDALAVARMTELQLLPVGRAALELRLQAIDELVQLHLAPLAHEMVIGPLALDDMVPGGVC